LYQKLCQDGNNQITKIPRYEGIWLENRTINDLNFKVSNFNWGTKIRLGIKGPGGDKIELWEYFEIVEKSEKR
jgi:hypothetical protein